MKRIILFSTLILLFLFLFGGFFWFYEVRYAATKADVKRSFSKENSYIFISPLRARANGQEKIRLSIFVLDNRGLGVPGKRVNLGIDPNLQVETVQETSDNFGKAVFDVAATKAGEYFIEVTIDSQKLTKKAHLSFY